MSTTQWLNLGRAYTSAGSKCVDICWLDQVTARVEYISSRKKQKLRPKRNRPRKITWFNPTYSKNVTTRIGQKFLRLIDKHFPEGSKLHKIFNRSTVKISYSCMPNIHVGTVIKCHNARVCGAGHADNQIRCSNCRRPDQCPMNGSALLVALCTKLLWDPMMLLQVKCI